MYEFLVKQNIRGDMDEIWDFFSSPKNLSVITPPHLNFKILSDIPDKMFTGQMISYKVNPLLGIPMNWVTEITHVDDHKFFVDEQRIGPYKIWHHEHHFKALPNGEIEMTDRVSYVLPFGFLGKIAHSLFVKNQLKQIFDFRKKIVEERFSV
jgi:ligand-binding SRPBCC domain-containing protein